MAHLCFPEIWIWASPFLPSCLSTGLRMKPNSRWLIWSKYNLLASSDSLLCAPSPLYYWKDLGDVWRHCVSDSHCYYIIFIWLSVTSLWVFTIVAFWLLDRPFSFDTTVSVSGKVSVKSKTLREDAERSETDGTISSYIFMLMHIFLISGWREDGFKGEKSSAVMWGNSLESQQWGKISVVQAPALCSPWMGCQRGVG